MSHYCDYCQQEFKSIQGLLGHNRMKHNSNAAEYSHSNTASTEPSADEYSAANTVNAGISTPQYWQYLEELLTRMTNSSTASSTAQLEQQRSDLASMEQSLEELLLLTGQLVSRVTDLEEDHQQLNRQTFEQGRAMGWKEAEAIPGFLEMKGFNDWALQHGRKHPNFPVVKSLWDVPEVGEKIEKYKIGKTVINIVDDRTKKDGDLSNDIPMEFLELLNRLK